MLKNKPLWKILEPLMLSLMVLTWICLNWLTLVALPKEAWKILEVAYEGTTKVKISRSEDETVAEYNKRVLEIANE